MKRLTISMSDALFDKLDQVENKSLFIRKLIEGELRKGITYSSDATYESLAGDIEDLHHEIRSLSSRLVSIENQIADVNTNTFLTKDKFESDKAVSYQIPPLPLSEDGGGTPIIQTVVADSYSITNGLNEFADKDLGSVSANISDIQVNLCAQDSDKVLPVHSDEMLNVPFRSVVNVGVHKESVCPTTETKETPMNSMIITPGMADQPQDSFSAQADDPSTPSFIMPDLSDVATAASVPFDAAPAEPSVPSSPLFVMPDLSDVANPVPIPSNVASAESSFPSFVMPDLSDVATAAPIPSNVASSKPSVPSSPLFVIPELSDGAGHSNASPFELPPAMPVPASGIQMQSIPPLGSGIVQNPVLKNDSFKVSSSSMPMNEQLQGNILMYLPHGARIKRSIIKGLVSKKFSAEEIDAEINLMISGHSLQAELEDGIEYLLRP